MAILTSLAPSPGATDHAAITSASRCCHNGGLSLPPSYESRLLVAMLVLHGGPAPGSRLVPGATFELVRDAGLFPWLEQPQQLHAAVAGALRPSI